jgi:hypothetical protein
MNVQELIELLEDVEDQTAEVRLAHQPHYPLQYKVAGVAVPAEDGEPELDDFDDDAPEQDAQVENVVYILEGDHPDRPYASKSLWEMGR